MSNRHAARTRLMDNIFAPVGLLLVMLATATPFFLMHTAWAQTAYPFVYGAGALVLLAARLLAYHQTDDLRLKRLYRLEKWSPILFLAAIALLFYNPETLRDWLAFTMAGAAVQVFTGFAIPARVSKLSNSKDGRKDS